MDAKEKAGMVVGALAGPVFIGIMAAYSLWDGWVLSVLWGWYGPVFGLPRITVGVAIGVTLIFALLTHQYQVDPKEAAPNNRTMRLLSPFITGVAALILGRIFRP